MAPLHDGTLVIDGSFKYGSQVLSGHLKWHLLHGGAGEQGSHSKMTLKFSPSFQDDIIGFRGHFTMVPGLAMVVHTRIAPRF